MSGILPDGTLHNPNNYPDDIVRAAVLAADARRHERRSQAAKRAAVTRSKRQERKVYAIAKALAAGETPLSLVSLRDLRSGPG